MGVGAEACVRCDAILINDAEGTKLTMVGALISGNGGSELMCSCEELCRVGLRGKGESVECFEPVVVCISTLLTTTGYDFYGTHAG